MYAFIQGNDQSVFSCTGGTQLTFNQQIDNAFFASLDSGVYFQVDAISCNGCSNINPDTCDGPGVPV